MCFESRIARRGYLGFWRDSDPVQRVVAPRPAMRGEGGAGGGGRGVRGGCATICRRAAPHPALRATFSPPAEKATRNVNPSRSALSPPRAPPHPPLGPTSPPQAEKPTRNVNPSGSPLSPLPSPPPPPPRRPPRGA